MAATAIATEGGHTAGDQIVAGLGPRSHCERADYSVRSLVCSITNAIQGRTLPTPGRGAGRQSHRSSETRAGDAVPVLRARHALAHPQQVVIPHSAVGGTTALPYPAPRNAARRSTLNTPRRPSTTADGMARYPAAAPTRETVVANVGPDLRVPATPPRLTRITSRRHGLQDSMPASPGRQPTPPMIQARAAPPAASNPAVHNDSGITDMQSEAS